MTTSLLVSLPVPGRRRVPWCGGKQTGLVQPLRSRGWNLLF